MKRYLSIILEPGNWMGCQGVLDAETLRVVAKCSYAYDADVIAMALNDKEDARQARQKIKYTKLLRAPKKGGKLK